MTPGTHLCSPVSPPPYFCSCGHPGSLWMKTAAVSERRSSAGSVTGEEDTGLALFPVSVGFVHLPPSEAFATAKQVAGSHSEFSPAELGVSVGKS